jgi:lysophospholipase L1-like esterase
MVEMKKINKFNILKKNVLIGPVALFLFVFCQNQLFAQDPERLKEEVNLVSKSVSVPDSSGTEILFTGSATIKLWKDLQSYFPDKKIVNTGFGGSQVTDLQYYYKRLIIKYKPKQIFIYEGDNDIEDRGCPGTIFNNYKSLISAILSYLPNTEIVIISIKPSPARWEWRAEQREVNRLLKSYASQTTNVKFVDIWKKVLDKDGQLRSELYQEDGLHFNKSAYDILAGEIKKVIK